jgi:hypothetical protein
MGKYYKIKKRRLVDGKWIDFLPIPKLFLRPGSSSTSASKAGFWPA